MRTAPSWHMSATARSRLSGHIRTSPVPLPDETLNCSSANPAAPSAMTYSSSVTRESVHSSLEAQPPRSVAHWALKSLKLSEEALDSLATYSGQKLAYQQPSRV